ncbi:protein of unknown function [Kyrpidia spormannii]|uniref:Uncharacterized protein n=3 Tax=Kyrpidia spormannii TaxID=2055160 RepID=A0ACA8Z949_9BACL|nr:protein of unknown function [Kyrpidia spormannii]CAB3392189.1 protein of unknown function [Kyrpidia spormannii]
MKNEKIWRVSQQIGFVTSLTTLIGVLIMAWTIKDNPLLIAAGSSNDRYKYHLYLKFDSTLDLTRVRRLKFVPHAL